MFLAVRFSHAGWGLLLGLTCATSLPAYADADADTDSNLFTRSTLTGD